MDESNEIQVRRTVLIVADKDDVVSYAVDVILTRQQFVERKCRLAAIAWWEKCDHYDPEAKVIVVDEFDSVYSDFAGLDAWEEVPRVDLADIYSAQLQAEPQPMPASTASAVTDKPPTPEQILTTPTSNWVGLARDVGQAQRGPLFLTEPNSGLQTLALDLVSRSPLPERYRFKFLPRTKELEADTSLLQPIPYIVFLTGRPLLEQVFTYQRTKLQGEKRLHGRWSIGIGGHVNPVPNYANPYRATVEREIEEELGTIGLRVFNAYAAKQGDVPPPVMFIYDTSEPVNAVHVGGVHFIPSAAACEFECEEAMGSPGWEPLLRAHARRDVFEPWSQMLLEFLVNNRDYIPHIE